MANGWWDGANNGPWSSTSNWNISISSTTNVSTVPGAGETANFNNNAVVATRNVYLNGNRSIGQIVLNGNNRGTYLKGGTAATPALQTLTLSASGINGSADSAYFMETDTNTTIALTALNTPFNIVSTNASWLYGTISGSGFSVKKEGGGHLVFIGNAKTYTGRTWVSAGVLFVYTTMAVGAGSPQTLIVDSGAQFAMRTSNIYGTTNAFSWEINGNVDSNEGTITQYMPGVIVTAGGTFTGNRNNTLGDYYIPTGLQTELRGNCTFSSDIGVVGQLWVNAQTAGLTTTISGKIGTSGANTGSILKTGPGILTLSGANTFSGGATLNAGTVLVGNNAAFGTGTLTFGGASLGPNDSNARLIANNISVTASTTTNPYTGTNTGDMVYYGNGSGSGTISINNTIDRSVWLQGDWINFFGTINVVSHTSGMALRLGGGPGAISQGGTNGSDFRNTKFNLSGTGTDRGVFWSGTAGTTIRIGELSGSGGRIDVGLPLTYAANWQIGQSTNSTFAGVIAGGHSLTKTGSGILTLSGTNTYTGGTTLSEGGLTIGNDSALGTGTFTISNGSVDVVGARSITNALAITGSWTFTGSNTLTQSVGAIPLTQSPSQITVSASTLTLGGVISGAHELAKLGPGTLALTGANTFTGGAVINVGTVNLGVAQVGTTSGPLGASGTISLGGGTLQYSAANQHDYSSRFSTAANQQYRCDTNGQNVTWATALTSSGGFLVKGGSGTLTLLGNNTYTGNSTLGSGAVNVGALQTGGAGPLGNLTSGRLIMAGGTLQYSSANSFDYSPYFITTLGFVYNVDTNGQNVTWASILPTIGLSGAPGTLNKSGAGTLTLSAANTYSGGTTLSQGTLKAGNASAIGTGGVSVDSGATLAALASIGGKLNIGGNLNNSGGTLRIGGT